ncbi:MAG TPA: homocysteine S-methyltransferase [Segeticoccus sp.]|nr:homocysteine S-methyltransferase [Segeticoccus sp.]
MSADPTALPEGGVVVLDGGMSNALEDLGRDLTGDLWTARVLREAPDLVAQVHRAYYAAGAQVVTTASYQASVPGFVAAGMELAEAERLIRRSVTLATQVRDELAGSGSRRWVAASVGPYGAVLADGSEYRGRYAVPRAELRAFHRSRLELLAGAEPDFLAVETIPDRDEAEVLVELLQELDLPAWFSYSVAHGRTRAGQQLADAFATVAEAPSVFAVGVNCCHPGEVADAVRLAVANTGRPAVAYPNSGEQWDAQRRRWHGGTAFDLGLVPGWVEAGARYVGGCCRVGPETIGRLAGVVGDLTAGS